MFISADLVVYSTFYLWFEENSNVQENKWVDERVILKLKIITIHGLNSFLGGGGWLGFCVSHVYYFIDDTVILIKCGKINNKKAEAN